MASEFTILSGIPIPKIVVKEVPNPAQIFLYMGTMIMSNIIVNNDCTYVKKCE